MRALHALLGVVLIAGANPDLIGAQTATVTGRVTAAATGQPVGGTNIHIPALGIGTMARDDGRYILLQVPAGTHTIRAERIGNQAATQEVTVAAGETVLLDFELTQMALEMDEIVVTGTPGGTQRRALANSVGVVSAEEVVGRGGVSNVYEVLNARVPGVVVTAGPGIPGAGSKIQIRGRGSMALQTDPLVYVDGVRVESSPWTGTSGALFGNDDRGPRSDVMGRLNDINPEHIESIEVIKGPSAQTLYGTEAANGVIQIITKKGTPGAGTRVNLRVSQGANWFGDPEGRWPVSYARDPQTGQILSAALAQTETERGTPMFSTGHTQAYGMDIQGQVAEGLRYFSGADFERSEGVVSGHVRNLFAARLNLSATPFQTLDLTTSMAMTAGRSTAPGGTENVDIITTRVLELNQPGRGTRSRRPPEVHRDWRVQHDEVDRFTGSLTANHRPVSWLAQRLTAGVDLTADKAEFINRRVVGEMLSFFPFGGMWGSDGGKTIKERRVSYVTVDYGATATASLRSDLESQTSFGVQYYGNRETFSTQAVVGFPVPSVTSTSGAGTISGVNDDVVENNTVGLYVQEQLGLNNRMFLTGAFRVDDNSAFGTDFDFVTYPKLSASWVVSEEPFWDFGFVDVLKLRAAWGASGQQPAMFASVRQYSPIPGPGGEAAITPNVFGNPELKPERVVGIEAGFEASLLNQRLVLDFTYYNQRTRDALVLRDVAPSTGFSSGFGILGGKQWVNAGEIENKGVEALVTVVPVTTPSVRWDLTFNYSLNDNTMISLGGDLDFIAVDYLQNRHQPGYPVASFFRKHILSAQLDSNGRAISALCDDGQGNAIPCDMAQPVFAGRPEARHQGAFSTSVSLGNNLNFHALMDFKAGHKLWNVAKWARCVFDRQCEENADPLSFDPALVAEFDLGGGVEYIWSTIEDASYLKFREVGATYMLPQAFAEQLSARSVSITASLRNLYTWTRYSGLDPEGGVLSHRNLHEDDATFPPLAQFRTMVRIGL